jgi:hypothetical protein
MATPITIKIGTITLSGELNDSSSAQKLKTLFPLEFSMSRWGDEFYGDCGINIELSQDARDIMEIGELALWPSGRALCIFFGPTPASIKDEPRAISPVNPVGRLTDNTECLKELGSSVKVRIDLFKD